MGFLTELDIVPSSGGLWRLRSALIYKGRRDTIVVPAGFSTDFASVPKLIRLLLPADDPRWLRAAVVHDYLCVQLRYEYGARKLAQSMTASKSYDPADVQKVIDSRTAAISSRDTDGIFRRIARELGTPLLARWMLWTGVRLGAVANPARRPGWSRDAVRVVLLALAFLPLVVLCSVPVLPGLALYALAESSASVLARLYARMRS